MDKDEEIRYLKEELYHAGMALFVVECECFAQPQEGASGWPRKVGDIEEHVVRYRKRIEGILGDRILEIAGKSPSKRFKGEK